MTSMYVTTYFVLNKLHNGEDGVFAITTDEKQQPDGWYWLVDGMDDGDGPYLSREQAVKASKTATPTPKMLRKEAQAKLRALNGYRRKPTDWEEVGDPIPPSLLKNLETYSSMELGIDRQIDRKFCVPQLESVFLVTHKGGLYLVNTEGADYARRIRYVGSVEVHDEEDLSRPDVEEALAFVQNRH